MAQHVVAEVVGAVVADDLGEADLVVDDQEGLKLSVRFGYIPNDTGNRCTYSLVLVKSVPCLGRNGGCEQQECLDTSGDEHLVGKLKSRRKTVE
jgi:hypothetical protein